MLRRTRTGALYSPWGAVRAQAATSRASISTNASFDFESLIEQAIALETWQPPTSESEALLTEHAARAATTSSSLDDSSSEETQVRESFCESTVDDVEVEESTQELETEAQVCAVDDGRGEDEPSSQDVEESAKEKRKRREAEKKHAARAKKRRINDDESFTHYRALPSFEEKYRNVSTPIPSAKVLKDSKVVKTGYTALRDKKHDLREYSLDELVGENSEYKFDYVPWDGTKAIPIVSPTGVLTAVLAGHPNDPDWHNVAEEAAKLLAAAGPRCDATPDEHFHRRGAFVALQSGISHGGGQGHPKNMTSGTARFADVLKELNAAEPFRRISGFTNSVMASWAPDLYEYYRTTIHALQKHDGALRPIFPKSVFAAASYNLGPRTACFPHTDFSNLPFGWCAVTALGQFDFTKGGHLVLWDCRLVVEFPPGCTILLPSATVTHSNTSVAAHETRFSFAQYTAGAIFRWVENGFQKADVYENSLEDHQKAEKKQRDKDRWLFGLSLLPTFETDATDD